MDESKDQLNTETLAEKTPKRKNGRKAVVIGVDGKRIGLREQVVLGVFVPYRIGEAALCIAFGGA